MQLMCKASPAAATHRNMGACMGAYLDCPTKSAAALWTWKKAWKKAVCRFGGLCDMRAWSMRQIHDKPNERSSAQPDTAQQEVGLT